MLTQLLPSSTVACACSENTGLGTVASAMPGGTLKVPAPNSGGTRDPLQYCCATAGLVTTLWVVAVAPASEALVMIEYTGIICNVCPPMLECCPGPVSPRTPISQNDDPLTHWPVAVWLV